MITLKNAEKEFNGRKVLNNVSFSITPGEKIALTGANGVGKTTLLKVLAGEETLDKGRIDRQDGLLIGYQSQETQYWDGETVQEHVRRVTGLAYLEEKLGELEQDLTSDQKIHEYDATRERFERLNGYTFDKVLIITLEGFGIHGEDTLSRPMRQLSGGEKAKVRLSSILLSGVDLVLLDEPTNNLDLPALVWLEQFLITTGAACVVVSHDHTFLDRVVGRVLEIEYFHHTLYDFPGGFSAFQKQRATEFERQQERYEKSKQEAQRLRRRAQKKKEEASRGEKKAGQAGGDKLDKGFKRDRASKSASAAKSLEYRAEQVKQVERPLEPHEVSFLPEPASSEKKPRIELRNVRHVIHPGLTLGPINLNLGFGERVAILGSNGTGKSTLLKVMTGGISPSQGTVYHSPALEIGHFSQEHETLPGELTPIEVLHAPEQEINPYYLLAKLRMAEQSFEAPVHSLTPGERAKVLLALFALRSANALMLDEPTNHLDAESKESLIEGLSDYEGTIVVVSHDIEFLKSLSLTQFYHLENGKFTQLSDLEDLRKHLQSDARKTIRQLL